MLSLSLETASILIIPFAAIPLVILLSRASRKIAEIFAIAVSFIVLAFSLSLVYTYFTEVAEKGAYIVVDLSSLTYAPFKTGLFELKFLLDPLSIVMVFVVSLISSMVFLFSKGYMHGDKRLIRYYVFLLLFVGGMLILVLGANFFLLYIGWEIVGICSCILIGHWYERKEASKAGIKAFITTRLGDVLLLAGIALIVLHVGSLDYLVFSEHVHALKHILPLILLLALGGAIGKSAQLPLHVWLPDAMEGPTTVSALIHAATMVKAGVYLVARLETLTLFYPKVLHATPIEAHAIHEFFLAVALIGSLTAFLSATMAVVANDIKRVLAYSTISQLGYMFSALGLAGFIAEEWEGWYAGIFHLENHAIFKALLFLSAASVIHAVESRDMRLMGGLRKYMPITFATMLIGALGLAGIPPFNGFWSKDLILEVANISGQYIISLLLTITAFLTAFYTFRMIYLTFLVPESEHVKKHHPYESPPVMLIPLLILAAGAIISGLFEHFFEPLKKSLITVYLIEHAHSKENIITPVMSTLLALIAVGIVHLVYGARKYPPELFYKYGFVRKLNTVLVNGYYFDYLYEQILARGFVKVCSTASWYVERALNAVQVTGSVLLAKAISSLTYLVDRALDALNYIIADGAVKLGGFIRKAHTGRLSSFLTYTFLGLVILLAVVILVLWGV